MDRALFVKLDDITDKNVIAALTRAESLKIRLPEVFDGWYIAGLCYYKLGNAYEALYNFTKAYQISPNDDVEKYIHALKGNIKHARRYSLLHNIRSNNGIVLTFIVLILVAMFLIALIR